VFDYIERFYNPMRRHWPSAISAQWSSSVWPAQAKLDVHRTGSRPHRIEIMFGRLKDWRRIAMRHDRCAHTFFAAITLAATVIFWLGQWVLSLGHSVL